MELGRHGNDHVIKVGVEVSAFRDIQTEGRVVVVTSQQVVGVVDHTRAVVESLRQIWGPHSHVRILGLVHGHVRRPHAVINDSLSEVPLLEIVTLVLLVGGVNLREEDHLVNQLSLLETLVH
jgi:hypothetical protein